MVTSDTVLDNDYLNLSPTTSFTKDLTFITTVLYLCTPVIVTIGTVNKNKTSRTSLVTPPSGGVQVSL